MNRRGFIGLFVRAAAVLPVFPVALFASPSRVVVQQSPVAGFQYHEGEKVFPRLREGMGLRLLREPENRHDHDAVYAGRHKLGFVPRVDNTALAQMLDRGERLSARIIALERSRDPWKRVRFEVALNG